MKVAVVSALSVGMLGGAFVGINNLAFANAANNMGSIEPVTTEVNSEDFREREQTIFDITVLETSLKDGIPEEEFEISFYGFSFDIPEDALSKEDAAQIGAQYIYDMLGENIEGKFVAMSYFERDSHIRPYWQGRVGSSEEAFANHEYYFEFLIDAVTGERINIENHVGIDLKENDNSNWKELPSFDDEQIMDYTEVVNEFAQRHFTNSTVERIDFIGVGSHANEWIARFTVVDDTGRGGGVTIALGSQQLRSFETFGSDNVNLESDREIRTPKHEGSSSKEWVLASEERILIVDNTWLAEGFGPETNDEPAPHNLSIEEAAEIAAQLIYDEFGESVNGTRFDKIFSSSVGREFWNGFVYDGEGKLLFYYLIDARTGQRIELMMSTDGAPIMG